MAEVWHALVLFTGRPVLVVPTSWDIMIWWYCWCWWWWCAQACLPARHMHTQPAVPLPRPPRLHGCGYMHVQAPPEAVMGQMTCQAAVEAWARLHVAAYCFPSRSRHYWNCNLWGSQ